MDCVLDYLSAAEKSWWKLQSGAVVVQTRSDIKVSETPLSNLPRVLSNKSYKEILPNSYWMLLLQCCLHYSSIYS